VAYRLLAELVVLFHFAFIVFVMGGGLLVLRWRRGVWFHLPAAAWGAAIEFIGWTCPLTPLENWLRQGAGDSGYEGGFVEHYLLPIIYPSGWTPEIQLAAGVLIVAVNIAIYAWILWHRRTPIAACDLAKGRR
jgi:hypothetical protein